MHYVTFFNVADHPFRNLWVAVPGVVMFLTGAIVVSRRARPIYGWYFVLFGIFWTVDAGYTVFRDSLAASRNAKDGDCKIVEGRVANFHPMWHDGHGDEEHFDVNGVYLQIMSFDAWFQ